MAVRCVHVCICTQVGHVLICMLCILFACVCMSCGMCAHMCTCIRCVCTNVKYMCIVYDVLELSACVHVCVTCTIGMHVC